MSLSPAQVAGCEAVLDECIREGADLGQTAYILGTSFGETGGKMQPQMENMRYRAKRITEVFSASRRQGIDPRVLAGNQQLLANTVYGGDWGLKNLGNTQRDDGWRLRGAGMGQITGRRNMLKWGKALGVDLITHPELLMELHFSVKALVKPMLEGWATGKKLSDYVNGSKRDYLNARRTWNGTFAAKKYAQHAMYFEHALEAAGYGKGSKPLSDPAPAPSVGVPSNQSKPGVWASLFSAIAKAFGGSSRDAGGGER